MDPSTVTVSSANLRISPHLRLVIGGAAQRDDSSTAALLQHWAMGRQRDHRPEYLKRTDPPAELVAMAELLEDFLIKIRQRLIDATQAPRRAEEIEHTVLKLMRLILVAGDSGRPSVVAQLDDHETRLRELEEKKKAGGCPPVTT